MQVTQIAWNVIGGISSFPYVKQNIGRLHVMKTQGNSASFVPESRSRGSQSRAHNVLLVTFGIKKYERDEKTLLGVQQYATMF